MSLENYLSRDFGVKSSAAADLFARVDAEAGRAVVNLTPVYSTGGMPSYLTPAMDGWYKSNIQPTRGRAVEEVSALFEAKSNRRSGPGFLFEKERDAVEQRTLYDIYKERDLLPLNALDFG